MKPIQTFAFTLAALTLTLACHVQAQNDPTPPNEPIRPMTTEAQTTTAFFYQNPVVLNREQHKGLRLKPADASFAAKNLAVPLMAAEFPEACMEYPIVFTKGNDGQWLGLALTGLQTDENAFVGAKGQWNARYVPASVRRYPFILAESGNDQLSLAIDMAAPHLGKTGEALFDDKGEPTEFVSKLMPLLVDFQNQAKQTHAMAQKFDEAKLLTQQNLQVRLGDGRNAVVEGVWIIDEAKLRELPDDKILAWFKGGELATLHAQMLSLRNLVPLLERSQTAPALPTAKKTASKTQTKAPIKAKTQ